MYTTANTANWNDSIWTSQEFERGLANMHGRSQSQPLGNDFEGFFDFVTQQRVPDTGLMESQPRLQQGSWEWLSGHVLTGLWLMIIHIICCVPNFVGRAPCLLSFYLEGVSWFWDWNGVTFSCTGLFVLSELNSAKQIQKRSDFSDSFQTRQLYILGPTRAPHFWRRAFSFDRGLCCMDSLPSPAIACHESFLASWTSIALAMNWRQTGYSFHDFHVELVLGSHCWTWWIISNVYTPPRPPTPLGATCFLNFN